MDLLHLPLRIREMEIHDKIIVTATILFRSKAPPPPSRRSVTPTSSRSHSLDFDNGLSLLSCYFGRKKNFKNRRGVLFFFFLNSKIFDYFYLLC
jgi:hypothetical protein